MNWFYRGQNEDRIDTKAQADWGHRREDARQHLKLDTRTHTMQGRLRSCDLQSLTESLARNSQPKGGLDLHFAAKSAQKKCSIFLLD